MYRVDRRIHRHKKARRRLIIFLMLVFMAIVSYALLNIRITPKQDVQNAPEVTKGYAAATQAKVHIDKPLFSLDLPAGWKERGPELAVIPEAQFTFQSPSSPSQLLALYIDTIPSGMPVNYVVTVSAQGDGLAHDTVSGNCTTFTDPAKTNQQTKIAQGRWQNTDFLCDVGSSGRGVVGTQSIEGINQVTVTGPTKGAHKLFIRYTDNNVSPDYSILYGILSSLHFK